MEDLELKAHLEHHVIPNLKHSFVTQGGTLKGAAPWCVFYNKKGGARAPRVGRNPLPPSPQPSPPPSPTLPGST